MAEASPSSAAPSGEPAAEAGQAQETISIPGVMAGAPTLRAQGANATVILPPGMEEASEEPPQETIPEAEARLAKLETQYKSLQGIHRSLEAKAKRGGQAEEYYLQQREAAQQMAGRILALEAQIEEYKRGVPSQPRVERETEAAKQPTIESLTERVLSSLDSDEYDRIAAQHGEHTARAWMLQQAFKITEQDIGGRFEALKKELLEKLEPFEHNSAAEAEMTAAEQLFAHVESLRDDDGSETFPELKDPQAALEIARLWASQKGWTQEYKYTPQAVLMVISTYRQWKAWNEKHAPKQPQPALTRPEVMNDLDATTAPVFRSGRPMTMADKIRADFRTREHDSQVKRFGYAP
jgi:hypothetical protein